MHNTTKIEIEKKLEKLEIDTNNKHIYFNNVTHFSIITTRFFVFNLSKITKNGQFYILYILVFFCSIFYLFSFVFHKRQNTFKFIRKYCKQINGIAISNLIF